jgi:hypothetical protein
MNWTDKRDRPKYGPPDLKLGIQVCRRCGRTVVKLASGAVRDPCSAEDRQAIWSQHGLTHSFAPRLPTETRLHVCDPRPGPWNVQPAEIAAAELDRGQVEPAKSGRGRRPKK